MANTAVLLSDFEIFYIYRVSPLRSFFKVVTMCINGTMKCTMYRALRPTFRLLFSPRGTICYWNSSAKLYQSLALTCSGQRNNLVRPHGNDSKLHRDIFLKIITNCCLFAQILSLALMICSG